MGLDSEVMLRPVTRAFFRFRIATLLALAPSIAIASAMWAGYAGRPLIDRATLENLSIGLTGLVSVLLVLCVSDSAKGRQSSLLMIAALVGAVAGAAVNFYVVYLLASSGALPALVMNEDLWGRLEIPGIIVRVGAGAAFGVLCSAARSALGRLDRPSQCD